MALQIVYWQSTDQICCGKTLPIDVIICLDPALVGQQVCPGGGATNFPYPGISAQLVDVYTVNNDRNCCLVYNYTIRYDDTQLVPGTKLKTSDIGGILCYGCLLEIVFASAGNEVSLTQNEDGSYTLTSQHGCQYTFSPSGISVEDSDTIDFSLVGSVLSGDVKLSGAAGNRIISDGSGLFVPPVPVAGIVDTLSVDLSLLPGNILAAQVIISAMIGNQLSVIADGLFVPEPFITSISDTQSVDLTVTAGALAADVIISPDADNQLTLLPNGLYSSLIAVNDTDSVNLTLTGNILSADVNVSALPDNLLVSTPGGLYVPPTPDFIQSIADTDTIDLDVTANVLTANVNQVTIHTDGWIPAAESWSAPSATTITVPTDATLKYAVGDKIRLVQDAITKYFYVIEVTATLLTVTAGTDFTLSGNPITDPFYSHSLSPVGHPQRFAYTPTFNGFSVDPATPEVQWSLFGKMAHLAISTGEGVSDDTVFEVSLLVPMMVTANTFSARGAGFSGTDNGTFAPNIMAAISSLAPTILQFFTNSGSAVTWTAAGNKAANGTIDYPIT